MLEHASLSHGLSARGGLHVVGTRLRLHPGARTGVGWMAGLGPLPTGHARGLCAAELAPLLPSLRQRPFAVPWGKPFQLGRLTLALLPAGAGPGSSLLRLHVGGTTLLVATGARPDALPLGAALEVREADVLVVDGAALQRPHTPISALDDLLTAAARHVAAGQPVDVLVEEASVALQLAARWPADPLLLRATADLRALCARARSAGWTLPVPRPAVAGAEAALTLRAAPRSSRLAARTPDALVFAVHGDAPAPSGAEAVRFHPAGTGSALRDWIRRLGVAHVVVVARPGAAQGGADAASRRPSFLDLPAPRVTILEARSQLDLW